MINRHPTRVPISDLAAKRPTLTIAAMLAIAAFGTLALPGLAAEESLRGLQRVLLGGVALALLVVCVFLRSGRSTVISAVAISVSVLATLGAVRASGLTPSTIGLALAIGILIDDAIVLRERIVTHLELGSGRWVAARRAAVEVGRAMGATTLASMVFFAPILRAGSIDDPWLLPVAVTAILAAVVSWLVSASFVPTLSVRWPEPNGARLDRSWVGRQLDRFDGWLDTLEDRYHDLLAWSLDHRLATTAIAVGSFALALALQVWAGRTELSGPVDRPERTATYVSRIDKPIQLELRGPDSRTLSGVARRIADEVRLVPGTAAVGLSRGPASAVGGGAAWNDTGDRSDLVRVEVGIAGRAPRDVAADIDARLATIPLPPGYTLARGGEVASRAELIAGIADAVGVTIVLVYLVLAIQFGSLIDPLALLVSLPLSIVGVVAAVLIAGYPLDLVTGVGAVLVMGIATRQAILLVDFARRRRARGVSWRVALIEAGRLRFRPILMTACALVSAAVPVAVSSAAGRHGYAPLGRAVIGGLVACAPVTLLVFPTFYEALQEAKARVRRWVTARHRREPRGAPMEFGD